jgi:hypothetical protein
MEPDLFVPGEQQYQMVNEPLGIAPLIEGQTLPLPDFKKIALNVAKNKAIDYAAKKIGLNAAQAQGILSVLGVGSNAFAPLAAVSALTGRSLGISDYLSNKRANKAIQKNIMSDQQGNINTVPINIMNQQPTPQDTARGSIGTRSQTTSAPAPRQARQTSGIGGLHSGY